MEIHRPSILAVEDEESARVLLRHTLGDLCDLTVVEGPGPALDEIDSGSFDLFLLDINLRAEGSESAPGPGGEGVGLLHTIRERSPLSEVPAVAVTAYAMPGDRETLLQEGFDHYVEKPFTMGELREAVDAALPDSWNLQV